MNIKDAIERGLYPKDEKGRAIVPTDDPNTHAVIAATDNPAGDPILGWAVTSSQRCQIGTQSVGGNPYCWMVSWWNTHGTPTRKECTARLLPPQPRKVKVSSYHCLEKATGAISTGMGSAQQAAEHIRLNMVCKAGWIVINLTGEYEEPWDPDMAAGRIK